MRPSFAIYTLGCKVNQYDSYSIARELIHRGWRQVDFEEFADAYIVDTCTVTSVADHKSRKVIRRATRKNAKAIVAVTGCAAEWATQTIQEMTGAELIVRNRFKEQLPDQLIDLYSQRSQPHPASWEGCRDAESDPPSGELPLLAALPDRVRFMLKAQDGCNKFCSFCIIPRVRGRSRSRPVAEVVTEAREIIAHGFQELVLTGIQLGDYGIDLDEGSSAFVRLLDELQQIEGLKRLRISSILPQDLTQDIIHLMAASPRICRHLHVPLQAGSDAVLEAMQRGYTASDYLKLIDRLRAAMPDMGITTDIMVGFPGETEEDFCGTLEIAERVGYSGMHIFKYSRRPGTRADRIPGHLTEAVKEERSQRLFELSSRLSRSFAERYVGSPVEVLVEAIDEQQGTATGFTDTYVRTVAHGLSLSVGDMATVTPAAWQGDHLATVPATEEDHHD